MMTKFDPKTTLLIVALEEELPRDLAAGWQIVYSGVGKVNAAIHSVMHCHPCFKR